jgi:hypothetical protein
MAMQKVSEAIHRVLADTTVIDLSEAAVEDLKQELVEAEKHNKYFRRRIRVHHHVYDGLDIGVLGLANQRTSCSRGEYAGIVLGFRPVICSLISEPSESSIYSPGGLGRPK